MIGQSRAPIRVADDNLLIYVSKRGVGMNDGRVGIGRLAS